MITAACGPEGHAQAGFRASATHQSGLSLDVLSDSSGHADAGDLFSVISYGAQFGDLNYKLSYGFGDDVPFHGGEGIGGTSAELPLIDQSIGASVSGDFSGW